MTLLAGRFDKKCGKSGIPDNRKCSKKTTAKSSSKSSSSKSKASLQEKYYSVAGGVQSALALRSLAMGNRKGALRNLKRAAVSGSEVLEERAERTNNKRLLQFSSAKNAAESVSSVRGALRSANKGNLLAASGQLFNAGNTALEAGAFRAQSRGQSLSAFRERNRAVANALQKGKIVSGYAQMLRGSWNRAKDIEENWYQRSQRKRRRGDSLWAVGFKVDSGPSLSVGRGEKQSVEKGGGLTAKGRAKYNRSTGSNLKAPVTGKAKPGSKDAKRRKSFCARSRSWKGERGRAARRRWKC